MQDSCHWVIGTHSASEDQQSILKRGRGVSSSGARFPPSQVLRPLLLQSDAPCPRPDGGAHCRVLASLDALGVGGVWGLGLRLGFRVYIRQVWVQASGLGAWAEDA